MTQQPLLSETAKVRNKQQ